jgi:ribonuclease HI
MAQFDDIKLIKVPAHSGIADNERADSLAVAGVKANKRQFHE